MNSENVIRTIELCQREHKDKTFCHVVRVANYAIKNVMADKLDKELLYCMALCHDLLEDTAVTIGDIADCIHHENGVVISSILSPLTNKVGANCIVDDKYTYVDYIKGIFNSQNQYSYIIKLADMKDHLMQTETLTDELKKKYYEAIPYLL